VEVCEVASQLLGHPNVITVLIADMTSIANSAEIKYSEHLRHGDSGASQTLMRSGSYGRLYLQKIVQIQFNLPPSPPGSMAQLVNEPVNAQQPKRRRHPFWRFLYLFSLGVTIFGVLFISFMTVVENAQEPYFGLSFWQAIGTILPLLLVLIFLA
jgi:hypothetical protein